MSQCKTILKHLKSGNTLTAREAMIDMGIGRPQSRINDLRNLGHPIVTTMTTVNDKTFAVYSLAA